MSETDQLSLSSLPERGRLDHPLSSKSYVTAPVHSQHSEQRNLESKVLHRCSHFQSYII